MDYDGDTIDIRPWPVADLGGRLVCLASLGQRGAIEASDTESFEAETDRFDLHAWAVLELGPWLAADESRILAIPAGRLDDDDLATCVDALAAAAAIAWAVRVLPGPSLGVPGSPKDAEKILDWCPRPWASVRRGLSSLRPRSDEELATERERWDVLVWRLSLFDGEETVTDRDALREVVSEAHATGLLRTDESDFLTDAGLPLGKLGEDDRADLEHLAEIRLRTLNWVCGFGEDWQSAPLVVD
jgi:hypothetical protein